MVCFVDDDEARLPVNRGEPADKRLHRCNLHRLLRWLDSSRDDAVLDAGGSQFAAGLMDQLTSMHKDEHLAATGRGAGRDGSQNYGLACPGRCHQ